MTESHCYYFDFKIVPFHTRRQFQKSFTRTKALENNDM